MHARADTTTATKIIIVVEDSDEIRGLLEMVLETEGYRVISLNDGRDVVATARELRPELITLDLALPSKDGWAVVRELQEDADTRDIPVVIISAYTRELDAPDRRLVARVISKPFYVTQVITEVEQILSSH